MKKDFQIHSIDNGFCRVNYTRKMNIGVGRVYYCLQDEGENHGGVILYRCSQDWEPDYPITATTYDRDQFEIPTGDSAIEIAVREYLTKE